MGIPGEVPRNHKDSMPVVKERTYIHPQKYRDGYGKITNYSSLPSVKELREKLEPHEQALFRTTAIGHLLDIPIKQRWSGALFHYLLSREVARHRKKKSKKRGSGSVTSNLALGKVLARKEALKLFVTTLVTKTFALESSSLH
ncbi:hypothetical protein MKW92_009635 [Papaver armeniacum]|nr:hypothetical protein MKW92_009635 [Papaver armeniacum]